MLQKKICMLGAFGVGKTSLTRRFVSSIFSDHYLTTVGVRIDKKQVGVDGNTVNLLIWDIAGEDDISTIRTSYLRGAAGYLLVVDVTRAQTLDIACSIRDRVTREIGDLPFACLLNKTDIDEWDFAEARVEELQARGWNVQRTSAKTGIGVESAFADLARRILA
ncbi:MAG: Rab family GTPase [Panacagrimonas sp.]